MRKRFWWLLGIASVIVVQGTFVVSQATLGVATIALACFLAIVARIFQASVYQQQLLEVMARSAEAESERITA